MADIFDELEEDLKDQKIYDLWKAWGNWIIGVALIIVIGAACVPAWKYYHHAVKKDEAAQYASALALAREGKFDAAHTAFAALAGSGKTGYAQLASFQNAALFLKESSKKGSIPLESALKAYEGASLKDASDLSFSGLAKILAGYAGIESREASTLEIQFTPLASAGNPWQGLSLELQGIYALDKGDTSKGIENFNQILNAQHISSPTTARALLMMASLGVAPKIQGETDTKE